MEISFGSVDSHSTPSYNNRNRLADAIIAELSLTFWLLLKGINIEQWEKRARESA